MDSSVTRRETVLVPRAWRRQHRHQRQLHPRVPDLPRVKHYFKDQHPRIYAGVLELMHETTMQTEVGQLLDLTTQPIEDLNLDLFTLKRYKSIVKYKTAFYVLPANGAGLVHQGVDDQETLDATRSLPPDTSTQSDDYLDAYGAPEVIGKISTDIQDKSAHGSWCRL